MIVSNKHNVLEELPVKVHFLVFSLVKAVTHILDLNKSFK